MKKRLTFIITLFICVSSFFAQEKYEGNFIDLMNKTHKEIIQIFGIPDYIRNATTISVDYGREVDNSYYSNNRYDIIFGYQGLEIIFDVPDISLEKERIDLSLHVCGFKIYNYSQYNTNLPYNLTITDNLGDVFTKLGNPDEYSKEKIKYQQTVKNEDVSNRKVPYYYGKFSSYDTITITWDGSSMESIEVIRKHTFNVTFK